MSCGTIGSLIRIGGYQNFWFVLAGSIVSSIGQPFISNQVTFVSVLWFRPE
jgi:hypothetical protein